MREKLEKGEKSRKSEGSVRVRWKGIGREKDGRKRKWLRSEKG